MWVSIFVASSQEEAERIMQRLDSEGFMNRLRPGSKAGGALEIQVLESDAPDAQQFCY